MSLALISYIGEVVCLKNGSQADLGEPFWPTRNGRAILAESIFWASQPFWPSPYSGRAILAEPFWPSRYSGRAILAESIFWASQPFWPSRYSGRASQAEPFWPSRYSGRAIPGESILGELQEWYRGWLFGHIFHRVGFLKYLFVLSQISNAEGASH